MEVLQRTANRGSISDGGYEIDNSCKFEADNTEYLERDPSSAGDRQKFTTSMWVKRTELGQASTIFGVYPTSSVGDTTVMQFGFMSTDKFQLGLQSYYVFNTTRLFRDTSAWYHIVVAFDTTQSTAANRIKLYVNGIQETAFDVEAYPNQNHSTGVNFTEPHRIGTLISNSWYFSGYISEVNHIDGSQLAPTSFGEFDDDSGIWKPKAYAGSHGTNGFYLDFADGADLGDDESGNGNDFTENNITAADQATDTPTNNFATFNVAQPRASGTTIAEGGTEMYVNSNYQTAVSSIAVSKGKWYAEFIAGGHTCYVGFVDVLEWTIPQLHNGYFLGYSGIGNTLSVGMKGTDGVILNESNSATGATFGTGDIISVALDMDNRKAYFAVNGTYVNSSNPATAANPILWYTQRDDGTPWTDVITMGITGYSNTYHRCNFGGYSSVVPSSPASDANGYGSFEYAPPTGYYALCTKNLAEYG